MNDLNQTMINLLNRIASEDLGLIISVAAIVVTLLLVWLILRRPRLWYWKVDERAGTLKKIEKRLNKVEKQLDEELTIVAAGPKNPEILDYIDRQEPAPSEPIINQPATVSADEQEVISSAEKIQESEILIKTGEKNTYTGKSGRIYTREELESQIRD